MPISSGQFDRLVAGSAALGQTQEISWPTKAKKTLITKQTKTPLLQLLPSNGKDLFLTQKDKKAMSFTLQTNTGKVVVVGFLSERV